MGKKKIEIGKNHHNYITGKTKDGNGYVVLSSKEHGENKGRREHLVIMEAYLGRKLLAGEIVHHKNGIKDDNRIENLELLNRIDHPRKHGSGEILVCGGCGRSKWYSPVLISMLKQPYMCRKCYWKRGDRVVKLSQQDAIEIKKLIDSGVKNLDIAKKFGVSQSTICDIKNGRRHVWELKNK